MADLNEIADSLIKGQAPRVQELVQQALDENVSVREILHEGLIKGMGVVGAKFKNNEFYVPEVLIAARAMKAGMALIRPKLVEEKIEPIGKASIGTVKGDLHDIGKNLVAMMMATDWPAFDDHLPKLPLDLVKGGCGISGLYDLEPIRLCFLNDDLKLGTAETDRNSPVRLAPAGLSPLLLTVGGDEGPEYLRQSETLAAAWRQYGVEVAVAVLPGQNHFTIVDQLNDPEADLSRLILHQMGL